MENYEQVKHKAYYVPVDELELLENNPRTISKEQFDKLKKSVAERKAYFEGRPCLVNHKDGKLTVFAGNQRLRAARDLKMDKVPCVVYENLSKKEEKELTVLDNGEFGRWDMEILANEFSDLPLEELMGEEFDKVATELTPEQEIEEDEPPEVDESEPAKSEVGGVYQLGRHRLMCGDSTDEAQVATLMDDNKADMVFTDPPYGMNLDTDYSKMPSTKADGNKHYKRVLGDNEDFRPELITTVFRCFDYCGELFMFGADYYAELLPNKNDGSWIVWDKRVEENFDNMLGSAFELCWSKNKHKREIIRCNNTLFSGEQDAKNKVHPTQKPLKVIQWFLDRYSKDNQNIVDLFGGSGSTLIACEQTNRQCFMMELDPHYCDVIRKRFVKFTTGVEDNWEELTPREEK